MTKSVYIAAAEAQVGKSAVALALIDALLKEGDAVALFRPLISAGAPDLMTRNLLAECCLDQDYESAVGVTYDDVSADADHSLATLVARYGQLRKRYDAVVIIGSDFADVSTPIEVSMNARIAQNLDAPVVMLVSGREKSVDKLVRSARYAVNEFAAHHNAITAVIATRVAPEQLDETVEALRTALRKVPVKAAVPENGVLAAPTVQLQFEGINARIWHGSPEALNRESLSVGVSGMTLPNLLERLDAEETLVMASDRLDLLPGVLLAQSSGKFPPLAGLVLVGGYDIPDFIAQLVEGLNVDLPIGLTDLDTYATANALARVEGAMTSTPRKIAAAREVMARHVDVGAILKALTAPRRTLRTHNVFEWEIMEQAGSDKVTIVLPESEDARILEATAALLEREVCEIVLLGRAEDITAHAAQLDFDVSRARIVHLDDPELVEKYAAEYARLRAAKGVTLDQARQKMADPSYFGTMMVQLGDADGMVSGATHTTANTIRPALEVVKTKPGVKVVSGAYFMCMPDQVLVFADCAVNPNPDASALADIAISSADTAAAFGIEPRVAMLSYSTADSGTGPDVDMMREATQLVRQRRPDIPVDGPIQFDAAIDPVVGTRKMPDSPVAGQATVFIFPDLNAGNNCYKAVQRTAGAVAVGPVLQGLKKPVTDLSRGAMVEDIVSTVAITAIQAQTERANAAQARADALPPAS